MYQNGNHLDQYISNYSKVQLNALPKLRSSELLDAVLLGNPFESPHIQKWPGSNYTLSHTGIEILLSSKGKSFKAYKLSSKLSSKFSSKLVKQKISLLGRADTNDSTMSSNLKVYYMFLKHLDVLGPQMFGLVVHLQEAVCE
ncbi:hypothetical protein BD769DRAFT_1388095 [Suillus cothurnatus]|nr:hypothetical protein BD769DRAFT_1388095 [Suillus cothurnatus]